MNHLTSLIAKAKAATPGKWYEVKTSQRDTYIMAPLDSQRNPCTTIGTVWFGQNQEANAAFIATCNPHLILALCELAMAAEARMDFANNFTCVAEESGVGQPRHSAWDRLEELDKNLRAKLAAVRGVMS